MRTTFRLASLAWTALMVVAVAVVGCGPDNGLNLARVSGKVTFNGQPVKNGTVFFMPDEGKGTVGPPAVGSITADGSFIMSTESAGDGAIVGSHLVGITGVEEEPIAGTGEDVDPEADAGGYMKSKAKVAAATARGASKKEAEYFKDKGGKLFRYLVPRKFSNPQESGIIAKVEGGSNTFNYDIDEAGNVKVNP